MREIRVEFFQSALCTRVSVCVGQCRTSKSVCPRGGVGVTRIPGAAVHVGLIDSQRRRARVTRHQLQCAYAQGQRARARAFHAHEGRFREFRARAGVKFMRDAAA